MPRFISFQGTLVPTAGTLSNVNDATFSNISIGPAGKHQGFHCDKNVTGVKSVGTVSPPVC
eukprot:COSAG01_NODE_10392_length_2178_cov_1.909572_2_plen_61_part_00